MIFQCGVLQSCRHIVWLNPKNVTLRYRPQCPEHRFHQCPILVCLFSLIFLCKNRIFLNLWVIQMQLCIKSVNGSNIEGIQ